MSTKSIDTLVEDIRNLFDTGIVDFDERYTREFSEAVSSTVHARLDKASITRTPTLRMSNLGTPCERKLWYEINTPNLGEPLPADAKIKFMYGDILEEFLLFLAEVAGHKVEGRQDELVVNGVVGHRDAVIDGTLVDVKSASTYSFNKFRDRSLFDDDPFGYITQLQTYLEASQDDPLVTNKDFAYFLAIDKTLGHICLLEVPRAKKDLNNLVEQKRNMVNHPNPPIRSYTDEPDGKSGNRKLCLNCSYCQFKQTCWPSLRTFLYSGRPRDLTVVSREPNVPELK